MEISRLIKSLRSELGVSQETLARMLNVAHNTIARWEGGKSPRADRLIALRELAEKAGLIQVSAGFQTLIDSEVSAGVEHVATNPGSRRTVTVSDFQKLQSDLYDLRRLWEEYSGTVALLVHGVPQPGFNHGHLAAGIDFKLGRADDWVRRNTALKRQPEKGIKS